MIFKRLISFLNKLFSLDYSYRDIYDISDDDIKEFFKHLRTIGKREYTMAYFYKWHREYRDKLDKMNKIVDVKEAILAYLDGKKVRRYIPMEEYIKDNETRLKEGKRISYKHSWWENWVWNDGSGKKVKKYDINEILSPIEAFERSGFDINKKWEIKG